MKKSLPVMIVRGALVAATLVIGNAASANDELIAARLSELLGAEREAIAEIPSSALTALTAPPAPDERGIATSPLQFGYTASELSALPAAEGGAQWECLTEALYFEARGETVGGMFAVGEVILNRVDSARYPDTICGVVNQGTGRKYACQFTYTCDGRAEVVNEPRAWTRVGKVARMLIDGLPRELTAGATHYHTTAVNPKWARRFPQTAKIGSHIFYRQPTRTASN